MALLQVPCPPSQHILKRYSAKLPICCLFTINSITCAKDASQWPNMLFSLGKQLNETALIKTFPSLWQQMAIYDNLIHLENIIQSAIRIFQRLTACQLESPSLHPSPVSPPVALPAPTNSLHTDSFHLSHAKHQRRILNRLCLYCGLLPEYPVWPPHSVVSTIQLPPMIANLTITVVASHHSVSAQALDDSGSAGNFISWELLRKLHIRKKPCSQVLSIHSVLGTLLGHGVITHCTPTVTLHIVCLHWEKMSFMMQKRMESLRPCINYHTLNSQTIKYRYPLPLVPAALEQLRGTRIFIKLDLHSAYNLIQIHEGDEWKTTFVTPSGQY